ncbi:MAG TPA: hypothetical protein PLC98_14335, partial [Anaerolineales bacterium]|nr:hypothetical protein [Anaerolineales bacterium]
EPRLRVSLPAYPFERRSYWIGGQPSGKAAPALKPRDTADWFHQVAWREARALPQANGQLEARRVLVFDEGAGLGAAVAERLRAGGGHPLVVRRGD